MRNDASLLERDATRTPRVYTAQWNDDFHHALHVLLTGEKRRALSATTPTPAHPAALRALPARASPTRAKCPRYRGDACAASASSRLPPDAFVNFLQNHDQIGNRAPTPRACGGCSSAGAQFAAEALLALLPTPIMLFMGDEFHAAERVPVLLRLQRRARPRRDRRPAREFANFWRDADVQYRARPHYGSRSRLRPCSIGRRSSANRTAARSSERERSLAVRRRDLGPRLPARAAAGKLLGPATLTATLDSRRRRYAAPSRESRRSTAFRGAERRRASAYWRRPTRSEKRMAALVRRVDAPRR